MYTPVVYSGIMAFTLYIYDAPNKLFKDNNNKNVLKTTEEGNSPTCLAVRPFVSATTRAPVAIHTVAARRSVLTGVARTLVNF